MIKKIESKSVFRFLCVGGSSTLIDFLLYILFSSFMDISISKVLSMLFACIYSYTLNKKWTFSFRGKTNKLLVLKFVVSQIINIAVNTCTNTIVFDISNNKIFSFVIATAAAMIVNYTLQKYIVFRGNEK